MARKLLNSFNEFETPKDEEHVNVNDKRTQDTSSDDVNEESKQDMFTNNVNIEGKHDSQTLGEVKRIIEQSYKDALNQEKLEDTHERTTFYVRKDLNKRLDKLSKSKKRGFKKIFINIAIESLLNEMEKKK